ncbi:cyclodeaminase/cyclohydrolase family protein [Pseudomonas lopnurensis]|uniref:cyclodeaminase/cyclohydrolase family protein n=1 Tax=Pseudomonas lopnurensis TaxID=1477517 RepID=UPI0028A71BD8|nr:cyclodeaminase/cyclohydrolase family protein [Pseudomonas lopnurensis]
MSATAGPGTDTGLWGLSLAQFREGIANRATPGCGAAAAVAADFGLALVVKALRVSADREGNGERTELLRDARALLGRPGAFADDDVQAFSGYLQAGRDGPEQLQAASRQACAVPLATAHACVEALVIAERAWPQVLPMLRCDVQAGVLLIGAAATAVLLNVDADLGGLDDPAARAEVRAARQRLQGQVDRRLAWLAELAQGAARHC